MYLSRHLTAQGPRWALNQHFLPAGMSLSSLLTLPQAAMQSLLSELSPDTPAEGSLLPPIDAGQEVWGSGVTYLRSREARKAESATGDVYEMVYDAARPELFFKASGWRAVGHEQAVHIRADTHWNVPEPELTLVVNAWQEIVGYTVGNDMSSRDIEGENPLYLPQAKTYNGSCGIGPGIQLLGVDAMNDLAIRLEIARSGQTVFSGDTGISQMKRTLPELVRYLCRELDFPYGVLLMTGTGIVPPDEFTLARGDVVTITIGSLTLQNPVD